MSEVRERSLESDLSSTRRRVDDLEARLAEVRRTYDEDRNDWAELRRDLQTAVVVAETIRSEAQDALEALLIENQSLRESLATKQIDSTNQSRSIHDVIDDARVVKQHPKCQYSC